MNSRITGRDYDPVRPALMLDKKIQSHSHHIFYLPTISFAMGIPLPVPMRYMQLVGIEKIIIVFFFDLFVVFIDKSLFDIGINVVTFLLDVVEK